MKNAAHFVNATSMEKGFTLVELLIGLFLGLFLIGGAIQIYLSSKQAYDELDRVTYLQENLRYITDTLTREFRHVSAEDTTGWETSDQITVTRDYNCLGTSSGATGPLYEFELTYALQGTTLVCSDRDVSSDTVLTTNQPVVDNVASMDVELINGDGHCLTPGAGNDPAAGMCLTLVLQDIRGSNDYEVQFTVAFRNRIIDLYNSF